MPIGMPGWPELAFWTASIANARIALAILVCGSVVFMVISECGRFEIRELPTAMLLNAVFYQRLRPHKKNRRTNALLPCNELLQIAFP